MSEQRCEYRACKGLLPASKGRGRPRRYCTNSCRVLEDRAVKMGRGDANFFAGLLPNGPEHQEGALVLTDLRALTVRGAMRDAMAALCLWRPAWPGAEHPCVVLYRRNGVVSELVAWRYLDSRNWERPVDETPSA